MAPTLDASFFGRDARIVARELVGQRLECGDVCLRITETEAYWFPDDSANHCRTGRTPCNAPMWGPPGHAYVYLCYGMHWLLNVSTNRDGEGAAVLIRAGDVIAGEAVVRARRGGRDDLAGPGKVTQALGLTGADSGCPCYGRAARLQFRRAAASLVPVRPADEAAPRPHASTVRHPVLGVGPRIGVGYAAPADRDAPARFGDLGAQHLSQRRALVAL